MPQAVAHIQTVEKKMEPWMVEAIAVAQQLVDNPPPRPALPDDEISFARAGRMEMEVVQRMARVVEKLASFKEEFKHCPDMVELLAALYKVHRDRVDGLTDPVHGFFNEYKEANRGQTRRPAKKKKKG